MPHEAKTQAGRSRPKPEAEWAAQLCLDPGLVVGIEISETI